MQDTVLAPQSRFASRYVLLERLHTGARSEVWLAEDSRAAIPVALKVLGADAAERTASRSAFEREWQLARGLNHPHTVRALAWHDGERPAYAMQYIDGTDASELVGRGVDVWGSVLRVMAETMDYWHRKGVVHGDLKPTNVLLDRRGVTYLADFGTVALIDADQPPARRGGTSAYAGPEQKADERPHPGDDVFAIAQVVAELITGDPDADFPDVVPAPVAALLTAARGARDSRPSMGELAAALEAEGITRDHVDLRALEVPLRRPASSIAGATPDPAPALPHGAFERDVPVRETAGVSPAWVFGGLLAVVILGVVFTQGLRWLASPAPEPVDTADSPTEPAEPAEPDPEPAAPPEPAGDVAAARDLADRLVGELLAIDDELVERGVTLWGGVTYTTGKNQYDEGDRAYLAGDFEVAAERYRTAIAQLRPLLPLADVEYQRAMDAGADAFAAEDPPEAVLAYERALIISPADLPATVALARARVFADVLAEMAAGRKAEQEGDLIGARERFAAAIEIDGAWQPAEAALARVRAAIRADEFATRMSRGFAALNASEFDAARAAFNSAGALRPRDVDVLAALQQVTLAQRQAELEATLALAGAAEDREAWPEARALYAGLLEEDPNLDPARAGLNRSSERIELMARASAVLGDPDQLADIDALRSASRLLGRLQELSPRGPELTARADALADLLRAAAIPVSVTLRSDGQTEITVLRVAQLGTFTETELRLRPGLYTVVGSRRGYVDTRRQFRVLSGQSPEPVYVACEQPI